MQILRANPEVKSHWIGDGAWESEFYGFLMMQGPFGNPVI
jgi:hypothetical protein